MNNYYTGVGSRETPDHILKIMRDVAFKLDEMGWILRSGGADGADTAFQIGAVNTPSEIYLPWNNFNQTPGRTIDASKLSNYREASDIASGLHPAWDRLTRGPRALHTRNVYQVLGLDLDTPSRLLVCWAPIVGKRGEVKGGTNTAVKLARMKGIPVRNLYEEDVLQRVCNFIDKE